jgi:O-acetyl-ADP-ribose deacetylase (regulator of RNase III)
MQIKVIRADVMSMKVDAIVNPTEGDGVETSGGNLLCKFVIGIPRPKQGDDEAQWKLRQATFAALDRAEELAIASVALPPLWTSNLDECAAVMTAAVREFSRRARSLQRVIFCPFGEDAHRSFETALTKE